MRSRPYAMNARPEWPDASCSTKRAQTSASSSTSAMDASGDAPEASSNAAPTTGTDASTPTNRRARISGGCGDFRTLAVRVSDFFDVTDQPHVALVEPHARRADGRHEIEVVAHEDDRLAGGIHLVHRLDALVAEAVV